MIDTYRKLFDLLSGRERQRFVLLVGIMGLVALAEIFGLSTVLFLMNLLAEPDRLLARPALARAYETAGFGTVFAFQIALSLAAFAVILAAQMVKVGGLYALIRFGTWRGYAFSTLLLRGYLGQPYAWSLSRNSSDITKTVLNEADQVVNNVLLPGLRMLSNVILVLAILGFLLVVDPLITALAAVVIGGGYVGFYLAVQGRLARLGQRWKDANQARFRLVQEAAGGFKEVKLMGLEALYARRFGDAAGPFAHAIAATQVLREVPRFLMEALVFAVLLIAVMVLLVRNGGDIRAAVPVLGAFGFAVLKLLPALQQIYYGLAAIRGGKPFLDAIHSDVTEARAAAEVPAPAGPPLPLSRSLELRGVAYSYPDQSRAALDGLDLAIPAHSTIGIVGGTGAGKTTVVDVILGLLPPQAGQVVIDGTPLDPASRRAWQRSIGYVPQSIYLTDATVAENIAFGIPPEAIDPAAVERAARLAALHDFVTQELPQGYATLVGERGVRLSGGQRQRIGIARALYHDPDLLVMDEATSALDNLTEAAVMQAIANIGHDKTIIMIAHRLSTVEGCDRIFLLEKGRVAAQGRYDELMERSAAFRRMARGDLAETPSA